jgi:hypothetical protein
MVILHDVAARAVSVAQLVGQCLRFLRQKHELAVHPDLRDGGHLPIPSLTYDDHGLWLGTASVSLDSQPEGPWQSDLLEMRQGVTGGLQERPRDLADEAAIESVLVGHDVVQVLFRTYLHGRGSIR